MREVFKQWLKYVGRIVALALVTMLTLAGIVGTLQFVSKHCGRNPLDREQVVCVVDLPTVDIGE